MVKNNEEEESGTMKVGRKKPQNDYVPQFLQQYKKEDGSERKGSAAADVQPNPKVRPNITIVVHNSDLFI